MPPRRRDPRHRPAHRLEPQRPHPGHGGDLAAAKAALDKARIDLDYTRLKSPISGRIGRSAVTEGALYDITDMREWREEKGNGVVTLPAPGCQSTLEQRGFAGCARHFITCVQNQTVPETSGEQAIMAQRVVERLWRDAMSE